MSDPAGTLPGEAGRATGGIVGPPGWLMKVVKDPRLAFLIVGGINTLDGIVFFAILYQVWVRVLAPSLVGSPEVRTVAVNTATLLSTHLVTVLVAFVLYRRFVFRVTGHALRDLARFESVYLTGLGLNWLLLNLLTLGLHLHAYVAQGIILVVTATISWFGHKHFSFRRSARDRDGNDAR